MSHHESTAAAALDPAELARVQTMPAGSRLEASGVYIDLNDLARGPFKAVPGQEAGSGNRYVAKRDVDPALWRRLVEVDLLEDEHGHPAEYGAGRG